MNADDFDNSREWRPFGTADAKAYTARIVRLASLGVAFWGRTSEDVRRKLSVPHPEIPAGFNLEDFRQLLRYVEMMRARTDNARFALLIRVGPGDWEDRRRLVQRAIEHLEGR